ncbi:hypothetical protein AVEN_201707-1 [Araneus ventricosus]|uniref:Uncharacterized protein n=1 Tax=Araneus ventricosus TaxID=182803 RepID=A0A4Y2P7A8_ARAVE|nr:hypothetical protein AVEN_201707-1 [Araneus ventricosus]
MWKHKWHSFAICDRVHLTASFHMTKPAQQHELIWFRNVASNKGSRLKIQRLLHHLNDFQELSNNSIISLFHYLQADMRNFLRPLRRSDSAPELFSVSTQKNYHFMEKKNNQQNRHTCALTFTF